MHDIIHRECLLLTSGLRAWLHAPDDTTHAIVVVVRAGGGPPRTRAKPVALREARRFCRRHRIACPESVSARLVAMT